MADPIIRIDPVAVASRIKEFRNAASSSTSSSSSSTSSSPSSSPLDITTIFREAFASATNEDIQSVSSYRIPIIAEEGSCGRKGMYEPEPFPVLAAVLAVRKEGQRQEEEKEGRRLVGLRAICQAIHVATDAEWVGIYEIVPGPDVVSSSSSSASSQLMKLAYVGAPSRPYFPLTLEFAAGSNNSTVAMTRQTILIQDVRKLPSDAPYYQCDATVKAELCAPIIRYSTMTTDTTTDTTTTTTHNSSDDPAVASDSSSTTVLGIIDVESWKADSFTQEKINLILDVCAHLAEKNMMHV